MTWLWPYVLGVLTVPALVMAYGLALGVRSAWANPKARQGLLVLVFGLALLLVVFLAGMNYAAWIRNG